MKIRTHYLDLAVLAALVLIIAGCGDRGSNQPGAGAAGLPAGPAQVLSRIAIAATAVAGTCLIACGFLAVFYANKFLVARLAVACVATIVAAQIAYQFGHHLGTASLVAVVALVGGAGVWAWTHLGKIEKRLGIDLNRDGSIGRLHLEPLIDNKAQT